MNEHEKINYVEFPAKDIEAAKTFFTAVFGWSFVDYGPEYTAFSNEGIDGGFFKSDLTASTENGSALIVFYSQELEQTQSKIEKAGGRSSSLYLHFRVAVAFTLATLTVTNMQFGQIQIQGESTELSIYAKL